MSTRKRVLRSSTPVPPATIPSPISFTSPSTSIAATQIQIVPRGSRLPGLDPSQLKLLRQKQNKLSSTASSTLQSISSSPHLTNALSSSLIFAQHEAGSAVCVDPAGWILTCAHCFGDDEAEYRADSKRRWLLFYTGVAVQVECRFWDAKRDLALLKVITIESSTVKKDDVPVFRYVELSSCSLSTKTSIICIGQPGRDDLESTSSRRTKYNLIEVSEGTFRGMVQGADPNDNSEIGTLMHDAWTYWGHSGAPLLKESNGTLVGLHSSWDDQTAMRHGISLIAIREFLSMYLPQAKYKESSVPLAGNPKGHPKSGKPRDGHAHTEKGDGSYEVLSPSYMSIPLNCSLAEARRSIIVIDD